MIKKATKRNLEYWDNILHDMGLGVNRADGSSKTKTGERRVSYQGTSSDLALIESQEFSKKSGRKKPKGGAE